VTKYKFLDDLTSDVMFEAYGETFEQLLENAALATFSVICDIEKVKPEKSVRIEVSGESEEELLHHWLCELIAQSEINDTFFSRFEIQEFSLDSGYTLTAIARGEPISQERSGTVVKGVTYYGFRVEKTDKGYVARVSLDI
jgi:SHS2 domain-containing protein